MSAEERTKKRIEGRDEVSLLVRTFYAKVRQDELLGPIFNEIIEDWEEHLEKLTDFWESNLFRKRKYFGNPMTAHVTTDEQVDHTVNSKHFGVWLNLWYGTLDDLFEGEVAEMAKFRARKMSTNLFLAIFHSRPEEKKVSPE